VEAGRACEGNGPKDQDGMASPLAYPSALGRVNERVVFVLTAAMALTLGPPGFVVKVQK